MSLISMAELLLESADTERWVVDGVIPSAGLTLVSAAPKAGKSTLMRVLCVAVARGEPWLGRPTAQGPVRYWCLEDKRAELRRHFVAMGAGEADPIHLVFGRVAPRDAMEMPRGWVKTLRARLVVVDPLFRLRQVQDISDYATGTRAFDPLIALARESGAAVVLTRAALVRRMPPLPSSNVASGLLTNPHRLLRMARRQTPGLHWLRALWGLLEGVIGSLRGQASLRLGRRRTEKLRTRKLGYDTFPSVGRVFRH